MTTVETENRDAYDAIVIGAGLSGLTCALRLQQAGWAVCVVEADDAVGGRVRTDRQDGFLLDRGFQVFLTSYPEAARWLDYDALKLNKFLPGALVRYGNRFHRFVDPWRSPRDVLSVAFSPVASLLDKLKVARLRRKVCLGSLESLYERPDQTTAVFLRDLGFSERIVERFFRPFLGGVFLDRELTTSSRMFEFVFRMFSLGDAALPEHGMQAIPEQLASHLPTHAIRLATRVTRLTEGGVQLDSGQQLSGRRVIVATGAPIAQELLPDQSFPRGQQSVACLYYAADRPPIEDPILVLNGEGQGPINNLCVPSQVSSAYAPSGQSLISVTVLETLEARSGQLETEVRSQLKSWFGPAVAAWRHLRTDWIPAALPSQMPPALSPVVKPVQISATRFVCGDHRHTASIQGAMESGRMAAEAALA